MNRRIFVKLLGAAALTASGALGVAGRVLRPLRALAAPAAPPARKILCLGLDGMDPRLLRRFMDEGALPNFSRLAREGSFSACGTTIPPQSPVAWSTFITGQDPGGHGIFDFIHRRPDTMLPMLSLAEAKAPSAFWHLGKWKLPREGGSVELLRRGRAFWEDLAEAGIDTTIFKIPSNYPPVECDIRSISGMGTPDILGTYGIFSYFTDDPPEDTDIGGGRIVPVELRDHRFTGTIPGPPNTYREGDPVTEAEFEVVCDCTHPAVTIRVGDTRVLLQEGEWSDWITLAFPMIPHLKEVHGICRFYLMGARPMRLYVTPVQIDPSDPVMPICTPDGYAAEVAGRTGPFFTQGLPDDTKALDEGVFGDRDYVSQSGLVLDERMRQYAVELERFRGLDRGFLFFYFNSLDQGSHMFWRNMDPASPLHADCGGKFGDHIRDLYVAMDGVLGQAMETIEDGDVLFAVSDHGFAPYHRSFHLNTWLHEHGYLVLNPRTRREDVAYLGGIDWSRTRAYGLGINGLYLNLRGRERRGVVLPGPERDALLDEIAAGLEAVVDPRSGLPAIKHAYRADEVFHGPRVGTGPDIVVGYHRGFRGSNETALGELPATLFADNLLKWSGDHCMAADEVPGIILCNRRIAAADPSLLDMAPTFLRLFGLEPGSEMTGRDILDS